jgi:hypothetical protein
MKKQLITVLLFFSAFAVFAQTNVQVRPQIDFNIRFYDKKIYYVQGSSHDPIYVQITLSNNSPSPFYFKLADDRVFSIDFDVRTTTNRPLSVTDYLVQRRTQSQQVYFRYIAVESGESFSFVEDVRDYISLSDAGTFIVQAKLYPDLYKPGNPQTMTQAAASSGVPLLSNRLSLNIRPTTIIGQDGIPVAMDVETNAILVRQKLSPDEIINYMLVARQKSQWEKFFLYVDLEAMINRDNVRKRQWLNESEEGRQKMVARYRSDLQNKTVDGDIVTIPMRFEIMRTNYSTNEGTVTVMEWFQIANYIEKKQYTYNIQKEDDIWMVVNYTVQNLGTE